MSLILNRREFIQFSFISGFTIDPIFSLFGRFMGQRNAFSGNHLGIIGAYAPGTTGFGPRGMHLRWLFPLERGFPNFFRVYRKAAFNPLFSKNIIPGISGTGNAFKQGGGAMPFSAMVDPQSSITISSDTLVNNAVVVDRYAEFSFSQPVRRLQIELACDQQVRVHAFSNQGQLLQETFPAGTKLISLFHEGITRISVELTFKSIHSITCTETINLINDKSWEMISPGDLRVFDSSNNALPDFNTSISELANYSNYFNTGSTYRTSLSNLAPSYRKLLEALKQAELRVPSADTIFNDPFKPAHELELRVNENVNQAGFHPLQWLLWAGTDPNIARLLQLYFVDLKAAEGTTYAYKVEAHYTGNVVLSGVLDNILSKAAESNPTRFAFSSIENLGVSGMESVPAEPQILASGTVTADQFSSRGTARIFLRKIANAADFNDSMFLLLTRNENGRFTKLADKRPIYPTEEALAGIKPTYTDYSLTPDIKTNYIANGIDLFGVFQSDVVSGSITALDTLAPPPPRKLNTLQRGGKTFLQFMYGGPEYLQGPDINNFEVHTASSIQYSVQEKFNIFNTGQRGFVTNSKGQRIYGLQCKGLEKLTGLPVNGTLQLTHDGNGILLPPSRRLRFTDYRLSQHTDNTVLIRVTTESPGLELPTSGTLRLDAAGDDPVFWGNPKGSMTFVAPTGFRLTGARAYNQPGTLANRDTAFTCRVLHRRVITRELGVDRITGRRLSNQSVVELYLDRPLHTSGLFKGAVVGTDISITTHVLEQFSGPVITAGQITQLNARTNSQVHCTRIWIIGSSSLTINNVIRFFPTLPPVNLEGGIVPVANPMQGMMRLLLSNAANPAMSGSANGGEIFVWGRYLRANPVTTATQFNTETIPLSLELLSDVYELGSGNFEVLVQCPKAILDLIPNQKARFFSLGEWDISSLIRGSIPATSGRLDTYFAIRSRDVKDNVGRMSKAMQVTQLRPTPTALGPMPRFCGTAQGTDQQAPLPDHSNHAMVCMEWDHVGAGMRYEVSRASGSAIINQYRTLWYLKTSGFNLENLVDVISSSAPESITVSRRILPNASPGIYFLRINTGNLNNLIGGRIIQNGIFIYQVLQVQASTATTADVVVKGTSHSSRLPVSQSQGNTLEREQPYHLIGKDSATLRKLADLNAASDVQQIMEQAFALLHSTPLPAPPYTDRMPANGTDRFFYKVRVVDAAENRGPWSAAGGAVLQLDMRAPEEVNTFSVTNHKNKSLLIWTASENTEITHIEIRRRTNGSLLATTIGRIDLNNAVLSPKPYFTNGKSIRIAEIDVAFFRLATDGQTVYDLTALVRQQVVLRSKPTQPGEVPVLIDSDAYEVDFVPVNSTNVQITGISFKENRSAFETYSIEINGIIAQYENGHWSFLDETSALNTQYTYEVRFIKSLGTLQIPSANYTSRDITLVNLAAPNISGITLGLNTNGKRQLNIPATNLTGLQVRVYRQAGSELNLINTRINNIAPGFKGRQTLPATSASQPTTLVLDEGSGSQNTAVTIQFINEQNIPSNPTTLNN